MWSPRGKSTSKRLLVIDDEQAIQELIHLYLSPLEVEVYPALSGEEGVALYARLTKEENTPHLVILNLKLPSMDGVEVARRIMQMDPDAVIYGFTASFHTWRAEQMKKAGVKEVIPRTVGFPAFRGIVKNILEGRPLSPDLF